VLPTARKLAELGCQIVETRFPLAGERLTQYLAMLGFGRPAMPRRPPFEAQNQIIIEIANAETARHRAPPSVMAMMADMAGWCNYNTPKESSPGSGTGSQAEQVEPLRPPAGRIERL
jgi:hypothetical protein